MELFPNFSIEGDITHITVCFEDKSSLEFDFVSEEEMLEIYESIWKKEPIKLWNKFLTNFSMSDYRELYSMEKDSLVDIYFDSIYECFFYSYNEEQSVDFTHCRFLPSDAVTGIFMHANYFVNTKLDFSYSEFSDFDLSLERCEFHNSKLYFIYSIFGNQDIRFNESRFVGNESEVKFAGSTLGGSGDLNFNDVTMSGYIELDNVIYGKKRLSFIEMNCEDGDIYFKDSELPQIPIEFIDSHVNIILLYKINSNGVLNLNVATANHIIIQECVLRDRVVLGNSGYKNYTSYCFKDTTILGKVEIRNAFSKRLFNKQKKFAYDPFDKEFVFCNTTFNEKADQLMLVSTNFRSEGNSNSENIADSAYYLSKRYRSLGRVQEWWWSYSAVGRTEGYKDNYIKRGWAYLTISVSLLFACISYIFEKVFLDIFCGRYATKPFRFLLWTTVLIIGFAFIYAFLSGSMGGIDYSFDISDTVFESMSLGTFFVMYSMLTYFQIDFGNVIVLNQGLLFITILQRIVGLLHFVLFAASFTRKVIKS